MGGKWLPEAYLPHHWNHQAIPKVDMETLQRLQNQVMWILLGKKDWLTPTEQLLNDCNMLSVHQLVFNATALAGYKATTAKKPAWLAQQMTVNVHARKSHGKVPVARTRTGLREASLAVKAIKAINHVPAEIKSLKIQAFRRELKK